MELARNCGECEYYIPSGRGEFGVCNRVDDPSFCYSVGLIEVNCIYDNAGGRTDGRKIRKRENEAVEKERKFREHCERTNELIDSWPKWKGDLVGKA